MNDILRNTKLMGALTIATFAIVAYFAYKTYKANKQVNANCASDLAERKQFLSTTMAQQYGNELVVGTIIMLVLGGISFAASITSGVISFVQARNIGWYSWNESVQRQNMAAVLFILSSKELESKETWRREASWYGRQRSTPPAAMDDRLN